jgi:hypothetical protein
MVTPAPLPASLTVTVNRSPVRLGTRPLFEHGHVLLPARATFETLHASVEYEADTRRITVRRGPREIVIALGSSRASVDSRSVEIAPPARVYESRAYVPLRFVAESLGARVDYDADARLVAIADQARSRAGAAGNPRYAPPTVEYRRPAPNETVTAAFPSISAAIETHGGPPIDESSVRMFLDGRDVTDRAYRSGDVVGYAPAQPVGAGTHEVTVQGADTRGQRFTSNWDFSSTFAYSTVPTPYNYGGFYVTGPTSFVLPGAVQLVLIAPQGGFGFANLCGYAPQFPFVYVPSASRYVATIPIPQNLFAPSCFVSGYFSDVSGARNYLALGAPISINTMPVSLSGLRSQATPAPRFPVTHPTPVPRPSPHTTPSARPTPHATPTTRSTPRISPTPRRSPAPRVSATSPS